MKTDDVDIAILGILKQDARTPISHIAEKLKLSRASVTKRIERMQDTGVIANYTITTKLNHLRPMVRAWMHIQVDGTKTQVVMKSLRVELSIQRIHSTNGKWDLLVELESEDLEKFDQALDRIRNIAGIANSETSILLSTHKT
ncbi:MULTISPECIES: Lrp/AsnC family transcriptional regulator [unclassified Acinetobacter]|uniref:Lrp/AsnC family transcriptional regulator n=1 Tax=unclassified Acinetobacter TaxID=196816 RepID=UPI0035BB9D6E